MARRKKNPDDVMDMIENFGEGVGNRINRKGSWLIKAVIMSVSIIALSGGILFVTLLKKPKKK